MAGHNLDHGLKVNSELSHRLYSCRCSEGMKNIFLEFYSKKEYSREIFFTPSDEVHFSIVVVHINCICKRT